MCLHGCYPAACIHKGCGTWSDPGLMNEILYTVEVALKTEVSPGARAAPDAARALPPLP